MDRNKLNYLNKTLALILAILILVTMRGAFGQAANQGQATFITGLDACANSSIAPSNKPVNIVSATTTAVIPLSGTTSVYLCEFTFTINSSASTAATMQFEYGTGASCGTGTTLLTGAMGTENAAAGAGILLVNGPYSGSTLVVPSGNALCIVTAGTTVNLQGQVTYKQL